MTDKNAGVDMGTLGSCKECGLPTPLRSTHTKCRNAGQNCVAPNTHEQDCFAQSVVTCRARAGHWASKTGIVRAYVCTKNRTFAGTNAEFLYLCAGLYGGSAPCGSRPVWCDMCTRARAISVWIGREISLSVHISAKYMCDVDMGRHMPERRKI